MRSQRWFPVVVGAVVVSCGLMLSLILSDAGTAEKRTESDAEKALRYNNLGIAYLAQYKPAEAERQFRRAVALDPNSIVGHVNIGIAALAQVHYDQAVDAFQAALRLDPDNIYAHFNLSLIYKLQGKPEDALRETLRAADGDPRDPDIQYHIGSLYMTNREYDKAIEKFNTVLKLDPDFLSAYYSLGRAYMAKGNIAKAKEFIEKHRQLQSGAGAGRSVGLRYGEQGRYSYAMDDLGGSGPPPALEPGEVSFIDVTAEAGIRFHQGHPPDVPKLEQDAPPGERSSEQLLSTVIGPMLGSGLALADVNGDGLLDLFLIDGDADNAASRLYLNRGGMRFEQTPLGGPGARPMVTGAAMSAAFGDLDGDADADLVVAFTSRVRAFINDGSGRFTPAPRDSGLGERIGGLLGGISLADVDHDGDLDIHVAGIASSLKPDFKTIAFPDAWAGAKDLLYINATGPASEDGTASRVKFIESAKQFHVAHDRRRSTGAVFSDFDNDRDIDFAVASPGDKTTIFSNMRDGTFRDLGKKSGLPAGARILGIAAGDYNKDGWMDLAVTTWGSGLPRLFRNMQGQPAGTGGGAFALDVTALAEVPRHIAVPQFGLAFLDFDNDGYLDLVTVNGSDIGSALIVLRNDGNGTFTDAGALVGIDRIRAKSGRGLAYGDLDGDGDLDLVISNAGGQPTLLRNDGGNKNHWLNVAAAGLHSNKQAIGTKIEVKSGRLWQKTEVTAGSGYLSQSAIEAHFGLGARRRIDTVRLLWPGGVLQDELKVQADAVFAVQELDRKGSSCPILYAWNGRRMAFISDFLGGSAIGYRTGLDTFNYPDTDEYVKIAADQLKAKDGYFELRFVNQLEETLFFDQARLLVVDHPAGVEVLPDERLMPFPPFPTFRLFSITKASPPLAARDDDGRDLLDAVSRIDRVYAGPVPYGTGRRFKGYAKEHHLTLDLGPRPDGAATVLLLHGWIDYADSTSNLAAAQAGLHLVSPYLDVLDESQRDGPDVVEPGAGGETRRGRWIRAIDAIGFPAGLPKTMTVDLTDKLPSGARIVRIGTSMRIYWDQIRVATRFGPEPRITPLEVETAELRFRGFPALSSPDGRAPEVYDYSRDQGSVYWKAHLGSFTRYGDVESLLRDVDDRYVITRPGDEITVRFPAQSLARLPAGWTRDFLLYADGFGKDMDLNSARPDSIGPLPYHRMTAYPPPPTEGYPLHDPALLEFLDRYNTRWVASPLLPLHNR